VRPTTDLGGINSRPQHLKPEFILLSNASGSRHKPIFPQLLDHLVGEREQLVGDFEAAMSSCSNAHGIDWPISAIEGSTQALAPAAQLRNRRL
jgi:hypothetical protein